MADFYTYPHVTTFSSWEDLMLQLSVVDLNTISTSMCTYMSELDQQTLWKWNNIFQRINSTINTDSYKLKLQRRKQTKLKYKNAIYNAYGVTGTATDERCSRRKTLL